MELETKRILRKDWQRTRDPKNRKMYNEQTAYVKVLLNNFKRQEWNKFTDTLRFEDKSIYKFNRRLTKKPPPCQPLKTPSGTKIFDDAHKAEIFADAMVRQFTSHPGQEMDEVDASFSAISNHKSLAKDYITPKDVCEIIRKLPSGKAPGHDGINNTAFKKLPKIAIVLLTNIYTACLQHCYFTTDWKKTIIVMIPKPGKDIMIANNHRPISLLTTMSKVFEKLHLHRLKLYIKLRTEQHAFRREHSTTTQLVNLLDDLAVNKYLKLQTASLFLDMERAFDRVWQKGLLHKLLQTGVPTYLTKIISSFLIGRTFAVKVGNNLSTVKLIEAGVPQGSCLSPLLYTLFINDFPTNPQVKLSLYADDTMFYTSNNNANYAIMRLQKQADTTVQWLEKWRLKLNVQKSVAVLFGKNSSRLKKCIHISGQTIEWSPNAKYLGITIDRKLNLNKNTELLIQKSKRARAALYPVLNRNCTIPMENRLSIYKIYIKPILLYAAAAWGPFLREYNWTKIEAVQNIAIRTITGAHYLTSNSTLRKSTNILPLKHEAKRASKILFHRTSMSKFTHLQRLGIQINEFRPAAPNRPINFSIMD